MNNQIELPAIDIALGIGQERPHHHKQFHSWQCHQVLIIMPTTRSAKSSLLKHTKSSQNRSQSTSNIPASATNELSHKAVPIASGVSLKEPKMVTTPTVGMSSAPSSTNGAVAGANAIEAIGIGINAAIEASVDSKSSCTTEVAHNIGSKDPIGLASVAATDSFTATADTLMNASSTAFASTAAVANANSAMIAIDFGAKSSSSAKPASTTTAVDPVGVPTAAKDTQEKSSAVAKLPTVPGIGAQSHADAKPSPVSTLALIDPNLVGNTSMSPLTAEVAVKSSSIAALGDSNVQSNLTLAPTTGDAPPFHSRWPRYSSL